MQQNNIKEANDTKTAISGNRVVGSCIIFTTFLLLLDVTSILLVEKDENYLECISLKKHYRIRIERGGNILQYFKIFYDKNNFLIFVKYFH